jgi:hypothetical protein
MAQSSYYLQIYRVRSIISFKKGWQGDVEDDKEKWGDILE